MTDSPTIDEKQARNRAQRIEQLREWAEYVRTHPDEEWGQQVNSVVNAQLQSARHFQGERPDPEQLRDSPLFDE